MSERWETGWNDRVLVCQSHGRIHKQLNVFQQLEVEVELVAIKVYLNWDLSPMEYFAFTNLDSFFDIFPFSALQK